MPTALADAPSAQKGNLSVPDSMPPLAGVLSEVAGPTAVLVLARDPILRAGVASQLFGVPNVEVIEPGDPRSADVAVIVTDVIDEDVLRVVRAIRRAGPQVVVVAVVVDTPSLLAALEAGATGFLRRSLADGEHLSHVVDKARRGERVLPPRLEESVEDRDEQSTGPAAFSHPIAHRLSARDLDVLRLVADGCDTAEIAQQLAYSEPTIKNVIQRLFERLNARNRPHAVAVALKSGII